MAATGGGKIRNRRYHIATKPYAKNKQQQSGLISRVTDTVKSIVPSWLQKYFKNEDGPEGGGTEEGTDQNCQLSPSPPQPPNGNEEDPPVDGRDSPEPSTSNTEPTTSRASLNFQECVLSRPPLNRSHLHLNPLDAAPPNLGPSNSLFSPPSTSSAPGPFTTGFSLIKEIKDNLSQHEDDNISTTSGFSSRASDKDVPTSKTASLPQLWSPEMDRSHTGPQPSQSSLKRPSFNLSVFGTSSNTFNNTVLNSSQLGDSSFYPGKTTYGGAAAARSSRNRPGTPYQAPLRRQIKAKPAGVQPCGVTSATARRILQSLERMSSPLADARRIPASASSPLSTALDSMIPDVPHSQAKKKRMDTNLPPVQKLLVPSVASTARNRSMSFRPTLTPGGGGRPLDKAPAETPTRQSPQLPEITPRPSQSTMGYSAPAYPLSSTPAANSVTFGGGKMKRERSSTRVPTKRHEEDGQPELPDLPSVSLPISSSGLPTFSFTSPLPASAIGNTSSVTVTPVKEVPTVMETPAASSSPSVPFTFSSPIVKAAPASTPSISPSAGFTFSAPVAKGPSMSNGKLANFKVAAVKPAPSKSTDDSDGLFKPAKTLKQGSVLDLLKTPGFTSAVQTGPCPDDAPQQTTASPPPTTAITTTSSLSSSAGFGDLFKPPPGWTCDACLVQNKPSDTKCVCCMTPQPNSSSSTQLDNKPSTATSVGLESSSTTSTPTAGFAAVFTKPVGTWDCDTCLVRNKADAVKCVACETAKPGTGLKTSLTIPSAFSAINAEAAPAPPVSTGFVGFGDKFKKAEGAWECDTCMVENKAEATKCVACMNTKPGASTEAAAGASTPVSSAPVLGFGEAFKKPEGSWDCDVCLVQNKAADVECVACQTPKPGAKVEPKASGASSSSTFGSSTSNSGGFKFGTTEIITGSVSEGFKFGGSFGDSSAAPTGFKFGVPFGSASSESASQDSAASSGFKFAGSSEGFKFGTASSDDKKSEPAAAASGFKFGNSGGIVFGTGSSNTEMKSGFSFGAAKPDDKPPLTTTTTTPSSADATPPPAAAAAPQENSNSVTTNDSVSDANSTANTITTTTATTKASIFARLGESPAAPAPHASSIFGSLPTKEPAAPTFTFGKPEEKEASQSPAPSGFVFGGANKDVNAAPAPPAAKGGFTFGKPSAPAEQPPPVFSFGKAADASETTAAEPPKAAFTFGQSAPDSSTAPKPAFSFVFGNPTNSVAAATTAAAAAAAAAPSSSITTPSLFGSSTASSQAPAPSAASSTFVFGQTATSSGDGPPAKTAFVFGKSQDSQPPAPSAVPPNSTASPAPAQPFMFGAAANAAAAAAPPPAAAPAFGFGAVAPSATSSSAPSAASSPFTFSSAPSGGFGASQAPSFGSSFGSPFTAPPSQSPPTFGANPNPNPTPVFGQQANSTPAFGANANSSAGGGFQFGASGFGATNNTSGVFTFGAGAAASPAPPANPAIPPQTGAAGPGFNFAQAPSFNIGSTKSFTASPAGQQAIAGRKFKMAVRRRK